MADHRWNHNTHYHRLAVRYAETARSALDVGCGEGHLTRELHAAGTPRVTGVDADASQVDRARAEARALRVGEPALRYLVGDVLDTPTDEQFDLVTCYATLHHLDLDAGLRRLAALTAPGGHLVVVGLAGVRTPSDVALSVAALPVAAVVDRTRGVWDHGAPMAQPAHGYGDVRRLARDVLPGVRWRRHLYWRYSLVWTAPRG
ncbi:class I SAM-dependent methyltransferase [Cellulomonas sp. URHB0016]